MPRLFSYGTLQQADVQLSTFGRRLSGEPDELPGYGRSSVPITDADVLATGETHYANVTFNGRSDSRVSGTVFEVSAAELEAADRYEKPAGYTRERARLSSGKEAWVYVHGRSATLGTTDAPSGRSAT